MFFIICFTISSIFFKPAETTTAIVHYDDVSHYIIQDAQDEQTIENLKSEKLFWLEKSKGEIGAYIYDEKLAKVSERLFEVTGDPSYLKDADHYYTEAASKTSGKYKAAVLLSQSSNSIKQHQFQKAYDLCEESFQYTKDDIAPSFMTFDASMELGQFEQAKNILILYNDEGSFDYLVRDAKYQDHIGNLEGAIVQMEKALALSKNKSSDKYLWALTNLGDMYGHDGQIQKSYDTYLTALKYDPTNLHVLKGIAWISYAHDNNIALAENILKYVLASNELPDAYLLLSELAEYKGDMNVAEEYKNDFLAVATLPAYEHMYAAYLLDLYLENEEDHAKAMTIAKLEVENRPTPETYANLALAMHTTGRYADAESIIMEKVVGKSFEPNLLSISGSILADSGCYDRAEDILKEAIDASYELGPVSTEQIKKDLETVHSTKSSSFFDFF